MNQKIVELDDIGPVVLKKFRSSKKLSLKVKHTGEVLVTMPLAFSYKQGIDFALSEKEWILDIKQQVAEKQASALILNHKNNTFGKISILLNQHKKDTLRAAYNAPQLKISFPHFTNEHDSRVQDFTRNALINVMRFEAKKQLPHRVRELATKYGFEYGKITIRNAKTRWGSCTSNKNISLSLYLMVLPQLLIDYVILHELCHTLEMNHSPAFYKHLNKVTDNKAIELRGILKHESRKWAYLKQ